MALAINMMHDHEHGCSNKMHAELQPRKTKVRPLILKQMTPYALYITNKMDDGPHRQYNALACTNNKMRPQIQPKKTKVKLAVNIAKDTNKMLYTWF